MSATMAPGSEAGGESCALPRQPRAAGRAVFYALRSRRRCAPFSMHGAFPPGPLFVFVLARRYMRIDPSADDIEVAEFIGRARPEADDSAILDATSRARRDVGKSRKSSTSFQSQIADLRKELSAERKMRGELQTQLAESQALVRTLQSQLSVLQKARSESPARRGQKQNIEKGGAGTGVTEELVKERAKREECESIIIRVFAANRLESRPPQGVRSPPPPANTERQGSSPNIRRGGVPADAEAGVPPMDADRGDPQTTVGCGGQSEEDGSVLRT